MLVENPTKTKLMERMFISTNYGGLRKVIAKKREEKGICLLEKPEVELLYFNPDTLLFQLEEVDNADLFLVKDTSSLVNKRGEPIIVINIETDYLMHHSTCNHNNLFSLKHSYGQHEEDDKYYTKVFNIIFEKYNNKAEQIIEFLFGRAEIQIAYRQLYKSLTLAYIKEKGESDNSNEMAVVKNQLEILRKYFNGSPEIQMPGEGNPAEIYQFLETKHSTIEEKLFG
jgi:hypothetical protein